MYLVHGVKMRIAWHGHSCFEFADDITVVIDPHDGKSIGIKAPSVKADLVLMTHDHYDHNAARIIRGAHKDLLEKIGVFDFQDLIITGFPTFHDEHRGLKRGRNVIYKFKMDGITICHCGDLGHLPEQSFYDEIGEIDVLFVPVGGVFTLEVDKVIKMIEIIKPKIVVPMHYHLGGLSIATDGIEVFLSKVPSDRVFNVGNMVELYLEDMEEGTEYWIFSL